MKKIFWCDYEVTGEQYKICNDMWGGENDIATEFECDYEKAFGLSAWYWSDKDHKVNVDLNSRPQEFSTYGYTVSYEKWGQSMVYKAVVKMGLTNRDHIIGFIHNDLKNTINSRIVNNKKIIEKTRKLTLFNDIEDNVKELDDKTLNQLVNDLYTEYFDVRKTLDEQELVNMKMNPNYFIYKSRVLEAEAKFLYTKAIQIARKNK